MRRNQPQDKIIIRLPDGMRDRLKAAASENMRTRNSEVVLRLEQTLIQPETKKADISA